MANSREHIKRQRISRIRATLEKVKKEGAVVNKEKLASMMIVEYCVSRKTALEEINAVLDYDSNGGNGKL